jgi:large subunit ribosomal protein L28
LLFFFVQTPACDLKTELALKIKRKILLALAKGDCFPDDAKKRSDTLKKYAQYIIPVSAIFILFHLDQIFKK